MQAKRPYYSRPATLDFLQSQVRELAQMAQANRLDLVGYFLDMAYTELSDIIRRERPFDTKQAVSLETDTAV
jgi:hypothetical protein